MAKEFENRVESDRRFHSERLMDLIGYPPGWLLKSGMSLIGFFTLILLLLSWFIHYPDIVEAPLIITSSNPPVQMFSNHSGIIDRIYVNDEDTVSSGQILVYIANPAHISDISKWKEWLEVCISKSNIDSIFSPPPVNLELGELLSSYSSLNQKYYEWSRWINDKSSDEKIKSYTLEKETISKLVESLERQLSIYENELSLQNKNKVREESLLQSGVISEQEYEKVEAGFLSAKRQMESIATGILTQRIRFNQLESLILDEKISYQSQLISLFSSLKKLCMEAIVETAKWKEKYVLESKTNGVVSKSSSLKAKDFISEGEVLFSIIPISTNSITYARASVPGEGLGRIEKGNKVLIRIDAWPYKQFGSIVTQIDKISRISLPNDQGSKTYELEMAINQPIITDMGNSITLKPEETGKGRIIARDRRVLNRIFDQLFQF